MEPSEPSATATTQTASDEPDRYFRTDQVQAELRGRTIRGGAATIASEGLKQALWLASTIVLARILTPSDNGLIAMVLVITGFIDLFNDLGLSAATIQRAEINQQQVSTLFWINLVISTILALLTAALAPAVAWFYGEPRLIWIAIALGSGFLFSGLTVQHRALIKRQMNFTALAILGTAMVGVEATVGVSAALAGFGYWSLVLMRLAWQPLEVIAIWLICPWRPSRPSTAAGVRSMLAFGGNLTGFRLVNYFARNLDNLLIGRFYGPAQLGIYSKAYSLLLLPLYLINNPVAAVAVPALSRLGDAPERFRQAYRDIAAKVCLLTMPLVAFLIGTSDWLILVLLGPQWTEASKIFVWLGISGLIEPFSFTMSWLLIARGRTRQQFHWGIVSTVMIVVAIVAGLPWGAVGVAASYALVSLFIRTPLLFWYVGREGPVSTRDLYAFLAPFAGSVGVTLAAIFWFRHMMVVDNPLLGLIICATITAVTTLGTLAILPSGRPAIRDLGSLLLLLKRKVAV